MRVTILALFTLTCAAAVTAQTKGAVSGQPAERGKLVCQQVCLSCHQADGGGVPNMNPPLIKSSWVAGDKKRVINIVLKGFAEKAQIDGAYYSNNMPPQATLTNQQIADVLTYIRVNFGNKATAITIAEVAAQRKMLK